MAELSPFCRRMIEDVTVRTSLSLRINAPVVQRSQPG
jgi:hypothetical protein